MNHQAIIDKTIIIARSTRSPPWRSPWHPLCLGSLSNNLPWKLTTMKYMRRPWTQTSTTGRICPVHLLSWQHLPSAARNTVRDTQEEFSTVRFEPTTSISASDQSNHFNLIGRKLICWQKRCDSTIAAKWYSICTLHIVKTIVWARPGISIVISIVLSICEYRYLYLYRFVTSLLPSCIDNHCMNKSASGLGFCFQNEFKYFLETLILRISFMLYTYISFGVA